LTWSASPGAGQDVGGVATVYLADDTTLPLRAWSLSYEFLARPKGTPQFQAATELRQASELWVDKKTYAVAGQTLEIVYGKQGIRTVVKEILLRGGAGKPTKLQPKPPHRDLLEPDAKKKKLLIQPRSLDLKGESITGTKRSFCLVSYTALVECSMEPAHQVLKIEFQ
jgi:hypothetical protein